MPGHQHIAMELLAQVDDGGGGGAGKFGVLLLMLVSLMLLALAMSGPLQSRLRREEAWFAATLTELYLTGISARTMMWAGAIAVGTGACLGGLLFGSGFAAVAVGATCYLLPRLYLQVQRTRRRQKLNAQLVDGILTISNGVASGLNLPAALQLVERNAPAPLSQEIGYLLREYEYGMPLENAMDRAAERVQLPNYRLLFLAMKAGMERGGRMADTLKSIAESLREISRLEDKVETMTAQGKSSARIMSVMPVAVLGILYMIDRDAVTLLFTTGTGRLLLGVVALILIAAWAWMQRIVSVDV